MCNDRFGVCFSGRIRKTGSVGQHSDGSDGDCPEKADSAMCRGTEKRKNHVK